MNKVLVTGALFLLSSSAFAGSQPNLFSCHNASGGYEVEYTSASFAGEPTFDVRIEGSSVKNQSNLPAHLTSANTALGKLVSIEVIRDNIQDAPALLYSIILPYFTGDLKTGETVQFSTKLIEGYTGGWLRPGSPVQSINQVIDLNCTAQSVVF